MRINLFTATCSLLAYGITALNIASNYDTSLNEFAQQCSHEVDSSWCYNDLSQACSDLDTDKCSRSSKRSAKEKKIGKQLDKVQKRLERADKLGGSKKSTSSSSGCPKQCSPPPPNAKSGGASCETDKSAQNEVKIALNAVKKSDCGACASCKAKKSDSSKDSPAVRSLKKQVAKVKKVAQKTKQEAKNQKKKSGPSKPKVEQCIKAKLDQKDKEIQEAKRKANCKIEEANKRANEATKEISETLSKVACQKQCEKTKLGSCQTKLSEMDKEKARQSKDNAGIGSQLKNLTTVIEDLKCSIDKKDSAQAQSKKTTDEKKDCECKKTTD